jgi:hypothetical protein
LAETAALLVLSKKLRRFSVAHHLPLGHHMHDFDAIHDGAPAALLAAHPADNAAKRLVPAPGNRPATIIPSGTQIVWKETGESTSEAVLLGRAVRQIMTAGRKRPAIQSVDPWGFTQNVVVDG